MDYEILKMTKVGDELVGGAMSTKDANTMAQAMRRAHPDDMFYIRDADRA